MQKNNWLQFFAEAGAAPAGDGAAAGAASGDAGRNGTAKASFDELLSDPDYRAEFDRRTQSIVKNRLGSDRSRAAAAKLAPLTERLAARYGCEPSDLDGIIGQAMNDPAISAPRADAPGKDTEAGRDIAGNASGDAENNAGPRDRFSRDEILRHLQRLREQSAEVLEMDPGFDLQAEIRTNPLFARLISPQIGLSPADAYFVTHRKEILAAGRQATVQMVSDSIRAGQARPRENGASGAASSVQPQRYSDMSPERRAELKRQMRLSAARGERFTPDRW